MKTISYAIPVCNEHREIRTLLTQLLSAIRKEDEIVVQLDSERVTQDVRDVVEEFKEKYTHYEIPFKTIEFPLAMDFAGFKNNLKNNCTRDYIFQIDADETLGKYLLHLISELLELNSDIDVFLIPRINGVVGITEQYINRMGWNVRMMEIESLQSCNYDAINFPDLQMRLMKNITSIRWENKVHEMLNGFNTYSPILPNGVDGLTDEYKEGWSIIHIKSFERQQKQNEFYATI